jgi:uncharacterized lipoprotein YajG
MKFRFKLLIILLFVTACSDKPKTVKLVHEKEVTQMNRQEVINAIDDCRAVDLRPVLYHARIKTAGRYIPIVVDISCAPKVSY